MRYFGGTKLGVGPLRKAYYKASIDVLNVSDILLQTLYQKLLIEVDFNFISHVPVSYTHLRAHETVLDLVCRLLLEKKKIHTTN